MNYRIVCIIVLMFTASFCYGQKRYLFHIYDTKNGLANNTIFSINQDKNGYVYFGTEAGLTRFDGYKMDNDVIPDLTRNLSCVDIIERDKDGFIVTTSQMQGIFVQQHNFTFKQYLQEKYAIGRNIFTVLKVIPGNRILLSGGSELSVFENGVFTKFYDNKKDRISIRALEYDKSGNIWLGGVSNLGGVAVFSAGDTTYAPYFIPELKDVSVVHMLFDKQGDLLIGSRKGLYKITFHSQGDFKKGYRVTQPFPQIESVINHLYIDSENNLWIATSSSGVYKTENGIITENITQENGLPAAGVMTTFQDSEKNYWFGTVSGVARLSDFNRYTYSHSSDLSGSIANDEFGRIYHFTQSGIFIIHNNIEKMHELKRSVVDPKESKFYMIGNNQLWILNNKGLYSVFCIIG